MSEIITGAPGGKRQRLADIVPLKTPLILQIWPTYSCNLKCPYCFMSIPEKKRPWVTGVTKLHWTICQDALLSCKGFPDKLKVVRFVGMGEPLLNQRLPVMVQMALEYKIAERVEVVTNGYFLHDFPLADLGLHRLVVSLQNLTRGVVYNNVKNFYALKKNTHVYVKIMDRDLGPGDEQKFYEMYGPISDSMSIEREVPIMPGVQYEGEYKETQFGHQVKPIRVCPQPFISLQINPDGNVVPCYALPFPRILGNVKEKGLPEIWNDFPMKDFQRRMKSGRWGKCLECKFIDYRQSPEDDLDEWAKRQVVVDQISS